MTSERKKNEHTASYTIYTRSTHHTEYIRIRIESFFESHQTGILNGIVRDGIASHGVAWDVKEQCHDDARWQTTTYKEAHV